MSVASLRKVHFTAEKVARIKHYLEHERRFPDDTTPVQRCRVRQLLATYPWFRVEGDSLMVDAPEVGTLQVLDSPEAIYTALDQLWKDPLVGCFRGTHSLHRRANERFLGITLKDVQAFVRGQETYQVRSAPRPAHQVAEPLRPTELGHHEVDLTFLPDRDLVHANRGYSCILVVIDIFSKYVWAWPLRHKDAAVVVEQVEAMWLIEGPPRILQSDRGGEFTGASVTALCERYGVDHRLCRAYHSECMGQVERVNRTLKDALFRWMSENASRKWTEALPDIVWAYNSTVHSTTKFTPYEVQRGRRPPLLPLSGGILRPSGEPAVVRCLDSEASPFESADEERDELSPRRSGRPRCPRDFGPSFVSTW